MRTVVPIACVVTFGLLARFVLPDVLKDMAFNYQNPNFGPAPGSYPVVTPPTPSAAAEEFSRVQRVLNAPPSASPGTPMKLDPRTGTLIPKAAAPAPKTRPAPVHPSERLLNETATQDVP